MRRLLSSPRRRRRLFRASGLVAAVGCAIAIGFLYPNTGREESVFSPGKPQVTHEEPPATPLSKSDLAATEQTLDHFVMTAVLRRHLDESYNLVTGQLRSGMTRAEWRRGEIPVIPFLAKDFAFAKSKLRYSHGNFARYDVLIWAKPHATTGSTSFSMELRAVGAGKNRRWLVDYFQPLGGGLSAPANQPRNPLSVRSQPSATDPPLGAGWVLVPLSIFGLIVLVPSGLAIRGWLRNRRAGRDYARTLPPLKPPPSST
ncbi:MAG: hypothetical protein M3R26_01995 [Actinomycetota bacterium]|nr:hypothetical protein [Actinomycetota bacterium]